MKSAYEPSGPSGRCLSPVSNSGLEVLPPVGLHVVIPWPLTIYLDSTRKGCTRGYKSMSASPDNRSSDILFLRYDLIRNKPEHERSSSGELTGRVQPIISETSMLGTYPHQQILHTR